MRTYVAVAVVALVVSLCAMLTLQGVSRGQAEGPQTGRYAVAVAGQGEHGRIVVMHTATGAMWTGTGIGGLDSVSWIALRAPVGQGWPER